MDDIIIGNTGFVGGGISASRKSNLGFNSRNIEETADRDFGTVFCAAAPGSMFEANRFPERDAARIGALCGRLARLRARRFVLISTIAALRGFGAGADETTADFETATPYGRNRRALEAFCAARFARCLIIRLPALFGPGLRKNLIFDLLNPVPSMLTPARREALLDALAPGLAAPLGGFYGCDAGLGMWVLDRAALNASPLRAAIGEAVVAAGFESARFTSPDSTFQFFGLSALADIADLALGEGLGVLHVAPAPLTAGRVHATLLGRPMPASAAAVHREDMRTRHAALFGTTGPYSAPPEAVLAGLAAFARGAGAPGAP